MGSFLGLTEKEEVDWREIFFRGPYRRLIFSEAHAAVAENNEDLLATWLAMSQSCRRGRRILAELWLRRHRDNFRELMYCSNIIDCVEELQLILSEGNARMFRNRNCILISLENHPLEEAVAEAERLEEEFRELFVTYSGMSPV